MLLRYRPTIFFVFWLLTPAFSHDNIENRLLKNLANRDTIINVWIIFTDKPQGQAQVSGRAALRRARAGFAAQSAQDKSLNQQYVEAIKSEGASLRQIFKWANAASFTINASSLGRIAALPFVNTILPVRSYPAAVQAKAVRPLQKRAVNPSTYGESLEQLSIIGVPQAHQYFQRKSLNPGEGVLVGVFDEGFWLGHPCFSHIVSQNAVIADSDFVTHSSNPYISDIGHGTQTMSLVGGREEGLFSGVADAARFIVARTEDENIESHSEEDNWAAAIVWAESLGVDIVTSSLGYRDGFTPPDADYTYEDMDGATTIVARAAQWAVERGVIVVNAMGNESSHGILGYDSNTVSSPADVEGVVSVGSVSSDLFISPFSSAGPASDGRIKPDLCAMGSSVYLPSSTGYTYSSGTSFSTPQVAGIAALVRQLYPSASADEIRRRIYASCTFVPGQQETDNVYGRGVPDALLACIDTNEIYGLCADPDRNPVAGAKVFLGDSVIAVTDSFGAFTAELDRHNLPDTLMVTHADFPATEMPVSALQVRTGVMLCGDNTLMVSVSDSVGRPVDEAVLYAWPHNSTDTVEYVTDGTGTAIIERNLMAAYHIRVRAFGYLDYRDTVFSCLSCRDSGSVILRQRTLSSIAVYPNVISAAQIRSRAGVFIDFCVPDAAMSGKDRTCRVSVRTADGRNVWDFQQVPEPGRPVSGKGGGMLVWDCRNEAGRAVAPGVYFVMVRFGGSTYLAKVLITG
jgi:subtilisin family serine protease